MYTTPRVRRSARQNRRALAHRFWKSGGSYPLPRYAKVRRYLTNAFRAHLEGDDFGWETYADAAFTLLTGDPNAFNARMGYEPRYAE